MIIAVLVVLGLCFGSFVNALVWRLHEQELLAEEREKVLAKKPSKTTKAQLAKLDAKGRDLSISKGRSMCTDCKHTLAWYDLMPVISWLSVGGRCRYCRKPISWQYPIVELLTALALVFSYLVWPQALHGQGILDLSVWLVVVVAFMALTVYDLRWMILPNVIVFPVIAVTVLQRVADGLIYSRDLHSLINWALAALVGGGVFYVLYMVSDGNWIGGGDVKLGFALGLLVGTPLKAMMVLMLASLIGLLATVPSLFKGKFSPKLQIPFGPCLMLATAIMVLYGDSIIAWYLRLVLP